MFRSVCSSSCCYTLSDISRRFQWWFSWPLDKIWLFCLFQTFMTSFSLFHPFIQHFQQFQPYIQYIYLYFNVYALLLAHYFKTRLLLLATSIIYVLLTVLDRANWSTWTQTAFLWTHCGIATSELPVFFFPCLYFHSILYIGESQVLNSLNSIFKPFQRTATM